MAGLNIWGIDPATRTGIAKGKPGERPQLLSLNFRHHSDDPVELIFQRAVDWLDKALREGPVPDEIVIEMPIVAKTFQSAKVGLGLYGIFTGIALWRGIRVRPANIGSWRSFAYNKAKMKTDEAKALAMETVARLGWEAPDHNAAEAGLIWLWGCSVIAPTATQQHGPLFARGNDHGSRKRAV